MILTYNQQSLNYNVHLNGDSHNTYTNDFPTQSSIELTPNSEEMLAGDWTSFLLKLKSANNKLYHHSSSNGWYENPE